MWIAKDRDGETYLYSNYPVKCNNYFISANGEYEIYLGNNVYPELTYENSPKKVELKIID